ncbi:hypothetical protein KP509_28G025700 [Ceratopteris richardii]|uniref:Uncharacterized protein n=1 Tax=Ceratopteris richardii TaxID=49495 RepID=A0A8T2RD37_CERRI|nr:hypothetical protein KP509_28G025700 [Ceratopteris richardii]
MAMSKTMAAPLLVLTFLMYLIVLGIAGWAFNRILDTGGIAGANSATFPFVLLSLIAGVVGVASSLTGIHHMKAWRTDSGSSAAASALIAWLLTLLAFGLACKEIHTSRFRGSRLKTLEAFVIIVSASQLVYLLLLHASLLSKRPFYNDAAPRGYGEHELGDKHKMGVPSAA